MLLIKPYQGVESVRFGMAPPDVDRALGKPLRVSKNRRGELSHDYDRLSVRFDKNSQQAVEIAITSEASARVEGVDADPLTPKGFADVLQLDGEPYEYMGFIILLRLGVTITGVHDSDGSQKALTAFAKGRWDHLRADFKRFSPT